MTDREKWVGKPLRRKEDDRLVRGRGKFVDDFEMAGMRYLHFVRSPFGHARVRSVDASRAESLPGVEAVLTGVEVAETVQPGASFRDHIRAAERARLRLLIGLEETPEA